LKGYLGRQETSGGGKELIVALDRDSSSVDWSTEHPVQIAALLKQFFRDLPDPLMTSKLHRLFIASAGTY
jgi:hypothetical protein